MSTSSRQGRVTRRDFIKGATLAASGAVALPNILVRAAHAAPANERIQVGVIGLGGRGRHVMEAFMAQPDTHVMAVSDCYADRRAQGLKQVNDHYGTQDCAEHVDFQELLARQDIDALLIATGDNNHSLVSIMGARAGKDMYCEKPLSVTIGESRAVADTMKRLGRVFQCGTQRRSISNFRFAIHLAQSGKLGTIRELHAEQAPGMEALYDTTLPEEPLPPKEEFDWDNWLGIATWRPYNGRYASRGFWSAHTDFSGGAITEWGSHTVDLCQWANGMDDTGPVEYWKEGDRYICQYANGSKVIIRRGLRFGTCPIRIEGDEGWVETGDSGDMETYPKSLLQERGFEGGYPPDNHIRAFLDCVYTRSECISSAETAHRSISVCHVANLCKRLGRPMKWDPEKEVVLDDEEANRMTTRAPREPWYL